VCAVFAQAPPKLAFEVVSIKPAPKGTPNEMLRDGRLHNRGDDAQVDIGAIGLPGLIAWAFDVPAEQVKGPDWMKDTNFDIVAKIPAGGTRQQVPEMLRSMLTERFHLELHREQKILPVYELKIAPGGVRFKESTADPSRAGNCRREDDRGMTCPRISMEGIAKLLTGQARTATMNRNVARYAPDRPVFDATGLTGEYDLIAGWGVFGAHEGGDPDAWTYVTAAEGLKKLGLKLESSKRTFDYVIIDHLERVPTEN
jgi:uncharacterized protein (TIGR03435 family)